MNPNKMINVGIFLIVASFLFPTALGLWEFYHAFQALRMNQTAGFGAVGGLINAALIGGAVMIIGILTGTVLILVGRSQISGSSNRDIQISEKSGENFE